MYDRKISKPVSSPFSKKGIHVAEEKSKTIKDLESDSIQICKMQVDFGASVRVVLCINKSNYMSSQYLCNMIAFGLFEDMLNRVYVLFRMNSLHCC